MVISFIPFENQGGSLWMEGNFVFLGVVIIVNIKILTDTNLHTAFSLFFTIGSILVFLVSIVIASNIRLLQIYGSVQNVVVAIEFYYILIFMLLAIVQIDIGVNYVNRQIRKRMIKLARHINIKLIKPMFVTPTDTSEDEAVRKTHLGFAFSQAPGNAPQITSRILRRSILRKTDFPGSAFSSLMEQNSDFLFQSAASPGLIKDDNVYKLEVGLGSLNV
jgi:hypothetical protein